MSKRYENGLGDMLQQNSDAKQFFLSLSEDIQGMVLQNNSGIRSERELKDFAEQCMETMH